MDLKIHSDFSKSNLDEMRGIYKSVGWTRHTNDIIKQIYEASNVVAIATINGQTVGLGRAISVLTDFIHFHPLWCSADFALHVWL